MMDYEKTLEQALQDQFGEHWFIHGAHPQTVMDYLTAPNDARRDRAIATMKRDAVQYASSVLSAGIHAGLVHVAR